VEKSSPKCGLFLYFFKLPPPTQTKKRRIGENLANLVTLQHTLKTAIKLKKRFQEEKSACGERPN
jgi:hypothetical protein